MGAPWPGSPPAAVSLWPHGQQVCGACDRSVSGVSEMVDEQSLFLPRPPPVGVPGGRRQAVCRCHRAHSAPTREQMLEGTLNLERSASVCLPAPLRGLRRILGPFPLARRRVPGRKGSSPSALPVMQLGPRWGAGAVAAVASPQNRGLKQAGPHAGAADGHGHLEELCVLRKGAHPLPQPV